jgi:short-chain Z-isoprenyl diphosphate synthase
MGTNYRSVRDAPSRRRRGRAARRYHRLMAKVMDAVRRVLYPAYESRMVKALPHDQIPKHVGVMLDGNRRWAKAVGLNTAEGYQAGADNIRPLLGWCEEVGVEVVTLWLLSSDNLTNRPPEQLTGLLSIIEGAVESLAEAGRWRIHPVGALDLLPTETAERLKAAEEATRDIDGLLVNVAVGYGGRREIADAVRALLSEHATRGTSLEELADLIDVEHIAEHLYTKGQPDPDLVIRTSGEQRLGGFLLWQSANSEFYFCEALWPDFRRVDFLRAIRAYAARERRFGG